MPSLKGIQDRLALAAAALLRRDYHEVVFDYARAGKMAYTDVSGEIEPFELLDFASPLAFDEIPPPAKFLRADDPPIYVSEPNVSRFLARYAVQRKLTTIVELGCFVGWTTAHFALAADSLAGDARVTAVDISEERARQAEGNLRGRRGAERVSFLASDSCGPALLQRLPAQLDLVFIDTSHHYEETVRELDTYGPRLSPRGCIALHDSLSFGGVRRAIAEAGEKYRRFTFATEKGNGLTLLFPRSR